MLEFYLVGAEGPPKLHKLKLTDYLGGMEMPEFASVQGLWDRLRRDGCRVDYFEDNYLPPDRVVAAIVYVDHFLSRDDIGPQAYKIIRKILAGAAERGFGIQTVCD